MTFKSHKCSQCRQTIISGIGHLIQNATTHRIPYSILVNIKKLGTPAFVVLPYGEGKNQLQQARILLARIRGDNVSISNLTFTTLISQYANSSPLVILCSDMDIKWTKQRTSSVYTIDVYDRRLEIRKLEASSILPG